MNQLLDSLNDRLFEVNTVEGAEKAVRHLLRDAPKRLAHSLGVVERLKSLVEHRDFEEDFISLSLQAAYLHDVGYSSDIALSSFHPYDGYLYLKTNGWAYEVASAVLYHTFSYSLMQQTHPELQPEYAKADNDIKTLLKAQLVTVADVHTLPEGRFTDVEGRLRDIAVRHGEESKVYQHLASHRDSIDRFIRIWGSPTV